MKLFHPANRNKSPEHERLYAIYEIWHTVVDFSAAFLFVVGSVLFFWPSTQKVATWMFVIGSICFALKPTIRLTRELTYLRMGKIDTLVQSMKEDGGS